MFRTEQDMKYSLSVQNTQLTGIHLQIRGNEQHLGPVEKVLKQNTSSNQPKGLCVCFSEQTISYTAHIFKGRIVIFRVLLHFRKLLTNDPSGC